MKFPRLFVLSLLLIAVTTGGVWSLGPSSPRDAGEEVGADRGPASERVGGRYKRPGAHPGTDAALLPTATPPQDDVMVRFDRWVEDYQRAGAGEKNALRAEGRRLAQERREVLKRLIRFDPEAALLAAVSPELRAQLPAEVAEMLETRVAGRGSLSRNAALPARGETLAEPLFHAAVVGGEQYRAYVYGRRSQQGSLTDTSLQGIALDGLLAVHESPVRIVDDKANHAGPVRVEFDGRTETLGSATEANALAAALVAREDDHAIRAAAGGAGSSGVAGRPTAAWAQGPKRLLLLRVDFPDRPGTPTHVTGQPVTVEAATTLVNGAGGVRDFYVENSYGKTTLSFTASDVSPVLRMPDTTAYYAGPGIDRSMILMNDAIAAAQAAGIATEAYDRVGLVFSRIGFPWDGLGNIIGRSFWINGDFSFYVVAHELGHTYGAMHSNFWYSPDANPLSPAGRTQEYGDFWDVMGSGNFFAHHFSQWNKSILQWLPDSAVTSVATSGTYRIHRFDHAAANLEQPRALKVRRDDVRDFWIGYRRATNDAAYDGGAYVLWGYGQNQPGNLLDLGGTPNTPADAPLAVGTTFTDAASGVVLRAVAQGGTGAEEWLDVEVTLPDGAPSNEWFAADIGAVAKAGSSAENEGVITLQASGADIWGVADAFHFRSQVLTGDGTVIARVSALANTHAWAKAGVMIREDFTPGSREVMAFVTPGNRTALQYRLTPDGPSGQTTEAYAGVPGWLRVTRAGNVFTAYRSLNGTDWNSLGTVTCVMPPQVFVGLALTSHNNAQLATATFEQVSVAGGGDSSGPLAPSGLAATATATAVTLTWTDHATDETGYVIERAPGGTQTFAVVRTVAANTTTYTDGGLTVRTTYVYRVRAVREASSSDYCTPVVVTTASPPVSSGWQGADIGNVGLVGAETATDSAVTVSAGGADIWGNADGFRFVYQPWRGDGEIRVRVTRLDPTDPWAKAGVMFRDGLTPGARNVTYVLTAAASAGLQVRSTQGGATSFVNGPWVSAPYWLKLSRRGDVFSAATSADGVTWTDRGSQTLSLPADLYVGLAVSSHKTSARTTAVFEEVQLPSGNTATPPVTLQQTNWGGGGGSVTEQGTTVTITGRGADIWGQMDDGVFLHRELAGDGEIVARLQSLANTHAWAKAGLMVRAGEGPTAANLFLGVTPGNVATLQVRATGGGITSETRRSWGAGAPCWLKVTRSGSVFTAAFSSDGKTWTTLGAETLALSGTLQAGLAISSHATQSTTAVFTDVKLP